MKKFENDEALWQHTHKRARLAFAENGQEQWRFTSYPLYTLVDFVENKYDQFFRARVEQAISQKQGLIVVHQGRDKNPAYLLATPELDVAKLKRDWCQAYAKAHGLMIVIE
jgi:iron-sulfur cluster repair protein YtfE (RIC family)